MPMDRISTDFTPTLRDLSNTFVLSSPTSGSGRVLSEVPKALSADRSRQRRAHLKSRTGCENCRRRRVKCNEEIPCSNCIRRGDRCQRQVRNIAVASSSQMPARNPSPNSKSTNTTVNLLHMRLFHHFQNSTRQTLLCGQEAWDYVLQLSFEFDYLMNAILCIAARHLATIHTDDPTYRNLAASHLCRASSRLRDELSKGSASIHFDAFLATSILFYYDTWSNDDYVLPRHGDEVLSGAWTDRVFGFSSSLKKTLLTVFQSPGEQPSVFRQSLTKNPRDEIIAAFPTSPSRLTKYEEFLSYRRPLSLQMLNTPPTESIDGDNMTAVAFEVQFAPDPAEEAYVPVARLLCLILPFLNQDQSPDSTSSPDPSTVMPLLAKFILSFPLLGWSSFPALIERGDSHALFVLYHFYRAVGILLPHNDWWWAHKRAAMAESVLRERLVNIITNQLKA